MVKLETINDNQKNSEIFKRPLIQGLTDQEIKKMMLDRNKHYARSNFKIDCENHKKNEIVDKIFSKLKENEIKSQN